MSAGTDRRLLMVAAIVLFTLADAASAEPDAKVETPFGGPGLDEVAPGAADDDGRGLVGDQLPATPEPTVEFVEDQSPAAPGEAGETEPTGEAPVAEANGPYFFDFPFAAERIGIKFTSVGSSDPDGGPLSFMWDFGDGRTSSEPTPTHIYDNAGSYIVTLTVADDSGLTDTDTAEVTISIAGPSPGTRLEFTVDLTSDDPNCLGFDAGMVLVFDDDGGELFYDYELEEGLSGHRFTVDGDEIVTEPFKAPTFFEDQTASESWVLDRELGTGTMTLVTSGEGFEQICVYQTPLLIDPAEQG